MGNQRWDAIPQENSGLVQLNGAVWFGFTCPFQTKKEALDIAFQSLSEVVRVS